MTRFSVVGLGKLGASMAAAIASRGFDVFGADVNERTVELFNDGHAPVQETGLSELIAENRDRLRSSTSVSKAVEASDVTFVVVPTPSDDHGAFAIDFAVAAFRQLGQGLADKDEYHLVVLTSTVLPGSTRYGLLPILEDESGKSCGSDFGLCYSPEFIALGSVIRDFLNPDFLLIGESDDRAGSFLERCYAEVIENHAPCRRMSFENAELTKIALNAYVTTKITFANMLADLCERIPGGDVDIVSDALGLDKRIGRSYLTGGLGFGGPCFPRDNLALARFAEMVETTADIPLTTHAVNEDIASRFVDRLGSVVSPGTRVGVLGLAYKPLSQVTEESQGLAIARELGRRGAQVIGFDPLAGHPARAELDGAVSVVDTLEECLAVDVLVIATPDPAFKSLTVEELTRNGVDVVVDCWRILADQLGEQDVVRYYAVGRSVEEVANASRLRKLCLPPSSPTALGDQLL